MRASAAPAYACSIAEIFECTPVAGCQRVSAQQANLPPFVTLNVRERRLFSGLFGGEGLFDPGDAYEDENVIILHGRHALLTWTAVVAKDTGQMSMSIKTSGLHPKQTRGSLLRVWGTLAKLGVGSSQVGSRLPARVSSAGQSPALRDAQTAIQKSRQA